MWDARIGDSGWLDSGFSTDTTDGFIMKDDSPNCIADSIVCALNYPEKELIISNERAVIIHGLRSTLLYANGEKNFFEKKGPIN